MEEGYGGGGEVGCFSERTVEFSFDCGEDQDRLTNRHEKKFFL